MRWLWIVLKSALIGVASVVALAVLLVVAAVAYATFVSQQRASGFGIAIGNRTITNPLIAFPLVIFLIASVIAFIRFARR